MYELVIVRKSELDAFQGIFFTFPDLDEYSMNDLYVKHPTKQGWWRHAGRADNVVVFLDARKLNPALMEAKIESHPLVHTAIICGHARSQPAVLIQPTRYPATLSEETCLLANIWPIIEQAADEGPVSARLVRSLVVFTTKEKPMPIAGGKNTV